jgi:hypothetical protein
MLRNRSIRLWLALFFPLSVQPCVGVAHDEPLKARQWDMLEISLEAESQSADLVDVELSAKMTHESGKTMDVSGFWNGDASYLIRFTPPLAGRWNYRTKSDRRDLDGRRGMITALGPRDDRKGAVVVSAKSPRRFRYQNGDSYYPIAFECDWLFALDAEDPHDIPNTRKFVDTLADNGFNQVVMNVFAYDVTWEKDDRLVPSHEYGSPTVFPFGGNNDAPDHSRLNVEYFQRLDRVIDYLDRRGVACHLMIYVWNKRVNWPAEDSADDDRYFDYVVKRYQVYPAVAHDFRTVGRCFTPQQPGRDRLRTDLVTCS